MGGGGHVAFDVATVCDAREFPREIDSLTRVLALVRFISFGLNVANLRLNLMITIMFRRSKAHNGRIV